MPAIAYQRAHGSTDFPHHFALFGELERRGLLDKYDFALDPSMDLGYCLRLISRFPQLKLTEDISRPRRWQRFVREWIGRGYRPFSFLDRFDAVAKPRGVESSKVRISRRRSWVTWGSTRSRSTASRTSTGPSSSDSSPKARTCRRMRPRRRSARSRSKALAGFDVFVEWLERR